MDIRFSRANDRQVSRGMGDVLSKLTDMGFREAGHWELSGNFLSYRLSEEYNDKRGLYLFVVDNEPLYLGACRSPRTTISNRLNSYAKASRRYETTESFINSKLRNELKNGNHVTIYVLVPQKSFTYNGIELDPVVGLERPVRDKLNPIWNSELTDKRRAKRRL